VGTRLPWLNMEKQAWREVSPTALSTEVGRPFAGLLCRMSTDHALQVQAPRSLHPNQTSANRHLYYQSFLSSVNIPSTGSSLSSNRYRCLRWTTEHRQRHQQWQPPSRASSGYHSKSASRYTTIFSRKVSRVKRSI